MLQKEKKIPLEELNFFEVLSNRKSTSRGKLYVTCGFYSCFFLLLRLCLRFFFAFAFPPFFSGGGSSTPHPPTTWKQGQFLGGGVIKRVGACLKGVGQGGGECNTGPHKNVTQKNFGCTIGRKIMGASPVFCSLQFCLGSGKTTVIERYTGNRSPCWYDNLLSQLWGPE